MARVYTSIAVHMFSFPSYRRALGRAGARRAP